MDHKLLKHTQRENKRSGEMIRELSNSASALCVTYNFHFFIFFNTKSITEAQCQRKIIYLAGAKANQVTHQKQAMRIL